MSICTLRSTVPGWLIQLVSFATVALATASSANAQFDGFLLPWKQVELASDESGILQATLVMEGQRVEAGDVIAQLNSDLEKVQFNLAAHLAQSRGNYMAAEKNWEKRQSVFDQVQKMHAEKHANDNELMRAELELELAVARLVAARDELIGHEFETQRAKLQLERRSITTPISGIVSALHVNEGEYVSPVKSEIATIVNVDQLYAVFNIPSGQVSQFEPGRKFQIQVSGGSTIEATVEVVGVEIDAESGTVLVKLLIDNSAGKLRAGDSCILMI
jgi:RND family efflux transporter MFP subunit